VLPRSTAPRFIANFAYRQNSRLSRFPPLKIPCYTAKLSYRHPPQVFRHKSCKTNLNAPVSGAHNYLLTAVYWSVIMECQNWSSDTVIDLIVEGRNRWSDRKCPVQFADLCQCWQILEPSFVAQDIKVIYTWQQQFIFICGVIGRSHLIVKLLAICCYVNFGFSFA
jgi:hypothetical protein